MERLIYKSAKAIAEAIRSKEVSSYEVVTACISRIEEVNQPTFGRVPRTGHVPSIELGYRPAN